MDVIETLKLLLDQTLHLEGRTAHLQPDSLLLDAVPELDSMGLVAVLAKIETRFGVFFDDDDLIAENFATLARLAEIITAKRGG